MRADEVCAARLAAQHPRHAARLLERLAPADAGAFLASQPARIAAGVLVRMSPAAAAAGLGAMGPDAAAAAVAEQPRGTAGPVLRRLAADMRSAVLAVLPGAVRAELERGLHYAEGTAGAAADAGAPALAQHLTAGEARRALRGVASTPYPYVYVTDETQRLVGVVHVRELAEAPASAPLAQLLRAEVESLGATADLSSVVAHPGWREFDALPVVDAAGGFLGALQHRHVRRARDPHAGASLADALLHLSELYWIGLAMWVPGVGAAPSRAASAASQGEGER